MGYGALVLICGGAANHGRLCGWLGAKVGGVQIRKACTSTVSSAANS